jgi:hypothetical protein
VLSTLPLLIVLGAAQASSTALRPEVFPVNPALTWLGIENFRKLYVDPATFAKTLTPTALPQLPATIRLEGLSDGPAISTGPSFPPTAALVLPNERNGWAEVAVNGTRVGVIGPLTVGAIHNVKSGTYSVTMTYADGFTDALSLSTSHLEGPLVPGGPGARVALGETVEPQPGPSAAAAPTMRRVEPAETTPDVVPLTPAPAPAETPRVTPVTPPVVK